MILNLKLNLANSSSLSCKSIKSSTIIIRSRVGSRWRFFIIISLSLVSLSCSLSSVSLAWNHLHVHTSLNVTFFHQSFEFSVANQANVISPNIDHDRTNQYKTSKEVLIIKEWFSILDGSAKNNYCLKETEKGHENKK